MSSCFRRLAALAAAVCFVLAPAHAGNPVAGSAAFASANAYTKLPPAAYLGANWVFASFDQSAGAGNEKLQLCYSQDGLNWSTTGDLYSAPTGNGVRDSSIIYVNGIYYVAYTAGNVGNVDYFQICQSPDLVNWTYLCNVNTSSAGYGSITWAPEWFVDRDGTVYIYFVKPSTGGVWIPFYVKATNLSLTAWTAPATLGLPSYQCIDPQMVRDGDTYYFVYRNYNQSNDIQIATGTSPTSITNASFKTGNFAGWGMGEGPCLVHLGGLRWRLYFQSFTNTTPDTSAYSDSFDGMNTWTAPAPSGVPQHGTILALNRNEGEKGATAAQGALAQSAVQPNTSPAFANLSLSYALNSGGGLIGQTSSGTNLFQMGFNAQAQYGGTLGAISGSQFFVYNFQDALGGVNSYYWGFNNTGDNYWGPSNTAYSVRVQQPRPANTPLSIQGASGQTAPLFQITTNGGSAGNVLSVGPSGGLILAPATLPASGSPGEFWSDGTHAYCYLGGAWHQLDN